MKYTIEQIPQGEDELILKYQCLNRLPQNVLAFVAPNTALMNGICMSNMAIGSLVTFAGLLVLLVKYYKQHI